jgi:DNA transposition AAA+ family ATPase
MSNLGTLAPGGFIETKEYRRFAEFCDAVRRYRYIGLCYGPAGVGKTLSARYFARWDLLEPLLRDYLGALERPPEAGACHTLFYTPVVGVTPRRLADELHQLSRTFNAVVHDALHPDSDGPTTPAPERSRTELVLVDEADRLGVQALEQLRDFFDRSHFGLVLIGMPGIETRLARYAQLYSRVGFVHQFRPLAAEEVTFILTRQWEQLGLRLSPDNFTDAETLAAVIRITGGNFRLLHRLLTQVERILAINELRTVTKEVVETAREGLVIGPL